MAEAAEKWVLVTAVVGGRREIIGWAREGTWVEIPTTAGRAIAAEEWIALLASVEGAGRAVLIRRVDEGWLPRNILEFTLGEAPYFGDGAGDAASRWRFRIAQAIVEAAKRYRDGFRPGR